jgi:hypothetical protein
MWRDEPDDQPMTDGLPFDAELDALDRELTAAGSTARRRLDGRRGGATQPDRSFAASLRQRLQATYDSDARPIEPGHDTLPVGSAESRPVALRPQLARRTPAFLPAPRWSFLAVAAALVIAVVGLSGPGPFPAQPLVVAGESVGATLARGTTESALVGGTELLAGDTVRVAPGGHATLELGAGRVRLDGGAAVRLDRLEGGRVELAQLSGRAWHRVVVPDGGRYRVATASLTWTAAGTAFDLDLAPDASRVRALAIEHDVTAEGPGLRLELVEGRRADIELVAGTPTVSSEVATRAELTEPWLVANARADARLGHPVGAMAELLTALASPTPEASPAASTTPSPAPSLEPSLEPSAAPSPTIAPTASPSPTPTPKPTPKPTPTPAPTMGTLGLTATACPGGVVLDWTASDSAAFNHYTTLRAATADIPLAYPPEGGAVDFGTSYTTDPAKTDAYDASLEGGLETWYRTMAFDAEDGVIAASTARKVVTKSVVDLGGLDITSPGSGALDFGWTSFGGSAGCFSYYKLVKSADDATPSYLEGAETIAAIGEQAASAYSVEGWTPGATYWFRLQAIRATSLGKFVVAETAPIQFTVP